MAKLTLSILTSNLSTEGNYTFELSAKYSFTDTFVVKQTFIVRLLHPCVRNVISPPYLDMAKTRDESIALLQEDRY